jgi:hypothetical protein
MFVFKTFLKIIAVSGILLSCFYVTFSIFFWINASFRGLSMLNAVFGSITFLTFLYFYFAIYTTKKVYYYNTWVLLIVMTILIFTMALINLLHNTKISDTALKIVKSQNFLTDIKKDINIQYFINACSSLLLCCYMIFSAIFVETARKHASGYNQPDLRNPASSSFFMMSL